MMNIVRFCLFVLIVFYAMNALRRWLNVPTHTSRAAPPPPSRGAGERPPHEVLEVAPNASAEEVRAAYQRLVQSYHPDQVAHLGPELREVAERRTKEINAAYSALKRRSQGL